MSLSNDELDQLLHILGLEPPGNRHEALYMAKKDLQRRRKLRYSGQTLQPTVGSSSRPTASTNMTTKSSHTSQSKSIPSCALDEKVFTKVDSSTQTQHLRLSPSKAVPIPGSWSPRVSLPTLPSPTRQSMSLPRNTQSNSYISPSFRENLDRPEQQSKSPTDGGKIVSLQHSESQQLSTRSTPLQSVSVAFPSAESPSGVQSISDKSKSQTKMRQTDSERVKFNESSTELESQSISSSPFDNSSLGKETPRVKIGSRMRSSSGQNPRLQPPPPKPAIVVRSRPDGPTTPSSSRTHYNPVDKGKAPAKDDATMEEFSEPGFWAYVEPAVRMEIFERLPDPGYLKSIQCRREQLAKEYQKDRLLGIPPHITAQRILIEV